MNAKVKKYETTTSDGKSSDTTDPRLRDVLFRE